MSDWNGFGGLDLSGVEADAGRATLRPGNYGCRIIEAEVRDTKAPGGKAVKVKFEDQNGDGTVEDFINVKNRNAEAERIGLQRLKALLVAAKHPNPDRPGDIASLKGLVVGVRVEQGEDWTDNMGQVKPGGGKVKRSGAYFRLVDGQTLGPHPAQPAAASNARKANALDDEIPF